MTRMMMKVMMKGTLMKIMMLMMKRNHHDVDDEKTLHISLYPRKPASLVIGPANDVLLAAAPIPGQKCCIEHIKRNVYGTYTHM